MTFSWALLLWITLHVDEDTHGSWGWHCMWPEWMLWTLCTPLSCVWSLLPLLSLIAEHIIASVLRLVVDVVSCAGRSTSRQLVYKLVHSATFSWESFHKRRQTLAFQLLLFQHKSLEEIYLSSNSFSLTFVMKRFTSSWSSRAIITDVFQDFATR